MVTGRGPVKSRALGQGMSWGARKEAMPFPVQSLTGPATPSGAWWGSDFAWGSAKFAASCALVRMLVPLLRQAHSSAR